LEHVEALRRDERLIFCGRWRCAIGGLGVWLLDRKVRKQKAAFGFAIVIRPKWVEAV
jgi:hypothetical protein